MFIRISAAVIALSSALSAQNVLYQTAFDDAAGWTGVGPSFCGWNIDALPASFPFAKFHSAPTSLNCNQDGGGYVGCLKRSATSPSIDLSAGGGLPVTLSFWCAFAVEEIDCVYDTRHVQVSNDAFQSKLLDLCLLTAQCGSGAWHEHHVQLDPAWGRVEVRFYFDTFDDLFCNWCQDGWFVDDMVVQTECSPSVGYCTAKVNSQGCTPNIHSSGVPSLSGSGNAFRIHADNVLSNQSGILIWSVNPASVPFGGGTLCLAPPVLRTAGQNSGGNPPPPDCSGVYAFQFTPALMQQNGLTVGDDVFTQYWSRDTGFQAPDNIGLTAGLQFTICQ